MTDYIGDKSFEELNLYISDDYQRPGPQTRDKTMQIDGKAGLWDFGADIAEKSFSLPCTLIEQDAASLQQSIRALTAHLFDAYGKPKTMKLIFGDEPDVYYMVRFAGNQPISRIVGVGQFSLPLTAFDPPHGMLIESTEELDAGSLVSIRDDMYIDDQYTFQINRPMNITVNNFGALNAKPVTEITGSFNALVLASGISSFSYPNAISGQTLIVDHAGYTIELDVQNKLTETKFLEIPPGLSNVYVGGSGLNCTITFKFRPMWQ